MEMTRDELEAHLSRVIEERIGELVTRNVRAIWGGVFAIVVMAFGFGVWITGLESRVTRIDELGSAGVRQQMKEYELRLASHEATLSAINATLQMLSEERRRDK